MGRGDNRRAPGLYTGKESSDMGTEVSTGAAGVQRHWQLLPFVLPSPTSSTSGLLRRALNTGVLSIAFVLFLQIAAVG